MLKRLQFGTIRRVDCGQTRRFDASVKPGTAVQKLSPDYSRSSSRGDVSRGRCEEKDDMAAQHIGQYVSKDMAFFDEAGARLTAPQQIARE